ncbi:MAG: HEAT repeat domain-containing protein [Candidatus Anammoxibacter sp.]
MAQFTKITLLFVLIFCNGSNMLSNASSFLRSARCLYPALVIIFLCYSFLFTSQITWSFNGKEDQALGLIHDLRIEDDFVKRIDIEQELVEQGNEIVGALILALDRELDMKKIDREFAISVIKVLSENKDPRAIYVLVKASYVTDWIVREEAVYGLSETIVDNPSNLGMFIAILGTNDTSTQEHAKKAILDLRSRFSITKSLITAMRTNKNEDIRIQIIDVLSIVGGDKVVDYLFSLLDDINENVRKVAVKTLDKMGKVENAADKDTLIKILNIIKDDITFYQIWNDTIKKLSGFGLNDVSFLIDALYVGISAMDNNLKNEAEERINHIGKPALKELNKSINDAREDSAFYLVLVDVKNGIEDMGKTENRDEVSVPILKGNGMERYNPTHLPVIIYTIVFVSVFGGIWFFFIRIFKLTRFYRLRGERWAYRKYQPDSTSYYKMPSTHVNIRGMLLKYKAEQRKEGCNICGKFNFKVIGKVVINKNELLIVQCNDDGLIWRTPLLSVPVLRDFFEKHYYISPYPEYLGYVNYKKMKRERLYMAERQLKLINDFRPANSRSKNSLLDVGCGAADLIAKAYDDGWEVTGTEISTYAVKNIIPVLNYKMHNDDKNVKRVYHSTLSDLITKKRIKKHIFDVVTVFEVLELVHDPLAFLALTKKVLTLGGRIFVGISAPKDISRLVRLAENQFHISEEIGIRMLEKTGFTIISTKSISRNKYNYGKILIAEYVR